MTDDQWRDLRIDLPNGYDADNKRATALLAERDALAERADALALLLRDCMGIMGSLRDYVSEGAFRMVGAREAIIEADDLWDKAHALLAAPSAPNEG